jgi:hypothetical protein
MSIAGPVAAATGDDARGTRGRRIRGGPCSGRSCSSSLRLRRVGFGLHRTPQALLVSLAPDAVRLLLLDARGVALYSDPQLEAEVEGFFVGETELSSQLVDPDLLRQV